MPDDSRTLGAIDWRSTFPFTHLFRSFRVAAHPAKMTVALALLLLLYCGGRTLDWAWHFTQYTVTREEAMLWYGEPAILPTAPVDPMAMMNEKVGPFVPFFNYEAAQVNLLTQSVLQNQWMTPGGVVDRIEKFLVYGPEIAFMHSPVYFTIFTIWFVLIWAIFGGATARLAAIHIARDEKISIRQALRFSTGKLLSFLFAPLIPLIMLTVLAAVIAAGGLLLLIPFIGPIAVSILFFLTLLVGLAMTALLFGTVAGFSLMYPTIAVEGSDSFDAISRSLSYVYAKPWRMLFYTIVSVAYGAITFLFLRLFLFIMLGLIHYFETWWLAKHMDGAYGHWQMMWPPPDMFHLPYDIDYSSLNAGQKIGAGILSFWLYLTISLLGAYAISFYFSANTIIYYLMRQEVDATELDDVFIEQSDEDFAEAPAGDVQATPEPSDAPQANPATENPTAATKPESGSSPIG